MINLFITNNKNLFCDVKTVPSVSADADHRLVLAKVKIKKPKEGAKCGRLRLKIDIPRMPYGIFYEGNRNSTECVGK